MRLYYANCRSIVNKLGELQILLESGLYDIVGFSETWLHSDIKDSLVVGSAPYVLFRSDRTRKDKSRGGGVCLLIHKRLRAVAVEHSDNPSVDMTVVDIIGRIITVRLVLVYQSPNASVYDVDRLSSELIDICEVSHPVCVFGDFNLPKFDWTSLAHADSVSSAFNRFVMDCAMTQWVREPTRYDNILDLFLCNSLIISDCRVATPFSISDHNSLEVEIIFDPAQPIFAPKRNYRRADFESMRLQLSGILWDEEFSQCANVEQFWKVFVSHLQSAINNFVPLSPVSSASTNRIPKSLRILQSRKRHQWKLLSRLKQAGDTDKYVAMRNKYVRLARRLRTEISSVLSRRELLLVGARDDKSFFRYANSKLGEPHTVSTLLDGSGSRVTDDKQKAFLLNEYFCTVFEKDNGIMPNSFSEPAAVRNLSRVLFSPAIVFETLLNFPPKFSSGPDGLPSVIFSKLADILCFPLASIFRVSFYSHSIPEVWRTATVIPLFKKGKRSELGNYRPVSLTCVCCRVMERIVKSAMVDHLESNKLLSPLQHGFRGNHSTVTQLLQCYDDWSDSYDRGEQTDIIYLDFAKAFDKVSHRKLIFKLKSFGIAGDLLEWCSDFLSDRKQSVRVGSAESDFKSVLSGVPQGSVLGPILFLLFVNDVSSVCPNSSLKLFADDIKLYQEIRSISDHLELNDSLNRVADWASAWQLSLNVSKCSVMSFGPSVYGYSIGNVLLTRCLFQNDLGVTMTNDGSFSVHCVSAVKKAMCRVNIIFRCFVSKNRSFLVKAFVAYVRPIVEYGSEVWSPYLAKDILLLESVQRNFTRRIPGLKSFSYPERLRILKLELLESRRIKIDLLMCYKIVYGHSCVNFDDVFTQPIRRDTRGHSMKLCVPSCKKDLRKYSFFVRVVPYWNALDSRIAESPTLNSFKLRLSSVQFPDLLLKY